MTGSFKQLVNSYIEFENGYQVFFEAGGVAPYSIMVHVWHSGSRFVLDQFAPSNAGGYLSSEAFAKCLYKISQAPNPGEAPE